MSGSTQLQRRGTHVAVGQLEASQRQRLIAAMAHIAAEHGRRAASVELVCERAGMSRRTFYDHFTDGEQCFVSAVGQAFDQLFAAINAEVGASHRTGKTARARRSRRWSRRSTATARWRGCA